MISYKNLYYRLFNAVSDSITAMQEYNYGVAKKILVQAQLECEDIYIDSSDEEGKSIEAKPDNIIIIPNERNT